jgi:predicted acylesterase/phospholipase RssA
LCSHAENAAQLRGAAEYKEKKMDRSPVLVDLAPQGGGSHGAFTWGVQDRLLEEK